MIDEYKDNAVLKWLYKMSPKARNAVIFGFYTLMMTQHNITMALAYLKDPSSTPRDRAVILFQFFLPKALWIGVTAYLGWPVLVMGYVVPLLVGNAMVISVTLPRWLAWLDVMHCRFGAHVAHHLFPHAPSRFARKIEERIAELWPDRFHVMPMNQALKLLAETPWVYAEDGQMLINPETGAESATLGKGLTKPTRR
jgi:fatty acid desaturase